MMLVFTRAAKILQWISRANLISAPTPLSARHKAVHPPFNKAERGGGERGERGEIERGKQQFTQTNKVDKKKMSICNYCMVL